jgi:hypothetical protein
MAFFLARGWTRMAKVTAAPDSRMGIKSSTYHRDTEAQRKPEKLETQRAQSRKRERTENP